MTFIDILFSIIFVIVLIVGFFKGMVKIMIAIGAFYLAIILASLYYRFVAIRVFDVNNTPLHIAQVISFFILLFFAFLLLLFAGLYTFRYVNVGGKLAYIDKLIGMGLALILGIMVITLLGVLLRFLFIEHSLEESAPLPASQMLGASTRGSFMIRLLHNNITPALYAMVDPVIPDEAGVIFGRQMPR